MIGAPRHGVMLMGSKTFQRHFLREKKAKQILLDFSRIVHVDVERLFGSKPSVELVETQIAEIFFINRKPLLVRLSGALFPTLVFDEVFSILPKITVDIGAVPHVCSGADVMAPGVVHIDRDFNKNDILLVVDERHGKTLAIGVALFDSQTMRKIDHGKIIRNLHYVGDRIWNLLKEKFDAV